MITAGPKKSVFYTPSSGHEQPTYLVSGIMNWQLTNTPRSWRPPTDLFEVEDRIVVRVEIAGMNKSDFVIELNQNSLLVSGIRSDHSERRMFHQMEVHFGEFQTEIELPAPIDAGKVEAVYQDGFLWIYLPKVQPKQIYIHQD